MKEKKRLKGIPFILLLVMLLPASLYADSGNQYCITPPFITAGVKPNLLLMIDNSASQYDLAYTDTARYTYCANDPDTTGCTEGATCSGDATCFASITTASSSTTSAIACTVNSQCVAPTGVCPAGATCTWVAGDTCNAGRGQCKKSSQTVTVTSSAPVSCSADSTCSAITAGDFCNNKCKSATRSCLDSSYSNTGTYTGYFKPTSTYCYSSKVSSVPGTPGWTECSYSGSFNEFDPGAVMPASCNYGGSSSATPYVCVNVDGTSGLVNKFVATGRFLNWLSISKFDIQKSILTGGKLRSDLGGDLIGESRGCAGRTFIKTVPGLALTFGIRGGEDTISNTSQATQYGPTFIEIYKGTYDTNACTAAMEDWKNVTSTNLGPLQVDTKNCIGGSGSLSDELTAANQAMHDCFWYYNGHRLSNVQPIKNACEKVWATTPASSITSASDPAAMCANNLEHAISVNDGGTGNTSGFLGACFSGGVWDDACVIVESGDYCQSLGGTGDVSDPPSDTVVTASSTLQGVPTFMMSLGVAAMPMINDYSPYANGKKGFLLAAFEAVPTGLIQKHKDNIRFGVLTFQNNGSGTECGTSGVCSATSTSAGSACTADSGCPGGRCTFPIPCTKTCSNAPYRRCYNDNECANLRDPYPPNDVTSGTCGALTKSDGSKIIAYVGAGFCSVSTGNACTVDSDCAALTPANQYCNPAVGDHNSGLLRAIDDIQATSWTPFAEGFYNAMGYFARSNDYDVSPPTSRSDANLSNLPAPNTQASYLTSKNPSQYRCQSNNILLITDGMSTTDKNSASEALATLYAGQVPYTIGGTTYNPGDTDYVAAKNHGFDTTNKCPDYMGSRSIANLAWVAKNRNIKSLTTADPASTTTPQSSSESISTHVVYSGPQTSSLPGLCDPMTLMSNTATNGGTTIYSATDPTELYNQLDSALSAVAAKAASGTAASILSNSEGSGANILQAVFYPRKVFESGTSANWLGEMQNLWYFVDPLVQNSTIREDTNGDLTLNLAQDNVVRFTFDAASDKTMVQRYNDSGGDGIVTDSDKVGGLIDPDYVKSIWRAGMRLWERRDYVAGEERTIYTGYNSNSGNPPQKFSNLAVDGYLNTWPNVWNALQIPSTVEVPTITDAQRQALATKLISYIRGTDQANDAAPCLNADCTYRNRKVIISVCSNNDQKRCTADTDCPSGTCVQPGTCSNNATRECYSTADCVSPGTCRLGREWKLGDIISSTPRVQSTVRLNTFNLPSPGGYSDKSYESYANSDDYKSRGMVYVGANDGMLHAFALGTLSVASSGAEKASLGVPTGTVLGEEKWAFIPKNSFPYLKYFSDKNYSHLYFVDGRTVILDASIGDTNTGTCVRSTYWECNKPRNGSIPMVNSTNDLDPTKNIWRTVVLAGMGLGGASRSPADACTEGATGSCVKTPVSGLGYSSYFALDVTYPDTPKFLWEFSHDQLGFSTSAPAIVRIGDKDKNGRWFAVFGSGPTGPIDPGSHQFKASSNQNLKFFVVDLNAVQPFVLNTNYWVIDTGITEAFAGSMLGASIDADRRYPSRAGNYQDDAIYAGYVKKASDNTWTDGGVVRIMTKEDPDPTHWVPSKVIDGIGAVTTAIARTQDTRELNRNLWLFFGTGRYFYRDSTSLDDNDTRRALFGIQEPCYDTDAVPGNVLDGTCTTTLDASLLEDQTDRLATTTTALASDKKGWRINLDEKTTTTGAERVVTDTVALTNGTVFFTSFSPNMDVCGYGGNSFLWGVNYDTGGKILPGALAGKALIQLSTGEFKEVDFGIAFTDKNKRRTGTDVKMIGKPPSDAPPVVSSSQNKPIKKILHIQEH